MRDVAAVKKEHLLGVIDGLIREALQPSDYGRGADDTFEWIGQAAAALERWSSTHSPASWKAVSDARSMDMSRTAEGFVALKTLLRQARADLLLEVGNLSTTVAQGQTFVYFDTVRKIIERAQSEVFFVDAYLDAEFVSRYLPHVSMGIPIRLLSGPKRMAVLLSSVDAFVRESGAAISVRSSDTIHDRFVFIDRSECYVSGASFKDGAKNAPAVVMQITDAFQAVWDTYEALWKGAKVER